MQEIPDPGVMKFIIWVDPSLVINTIHLFCLNHAPWVEKKIFKEIHRFYTFYSKITAPFGWGVMKFTISCLFTLQTIGSVVLEKKISMLTHDGRRTRDDGRRTTKDAIGHLSYSGDLKSRSKIEGWTLHVHFTEDVANKKHVYPLQTLGDKGIFHFTLFHWFSFRVGLGRRKFRIFVSLYWNIFVRPLQLFHCKTMSAPTLTFDQIKKKKGRLCSRVCRYVCEGKFYCVNYHRELS